MAQIHAITSFCPLDRAIVDSEGDSVALAQRHNFDAALHARPLFGQREFSARKIAPRFGQQDRHLDREGEIAVEILMQAVEVAGYILQQQRRRPDLTGMVALLKE